MDTKSSGVYLFAPEKGGRYEVWEERPLVPELIEYAASDIRYMFEMKDRWSGGLSVEALKHVVQRTSLRIRKYVEMVIPKKGRDMAIMDFEWVDLVPGRTVS